MKFLAWVLSPALILLPATHTTPRTVPHRAVVSRLGASAYGGPTIDDLTDTLDATRTASRIAQEAADAAERVRVAAEAQKAPQRIIAPLVLPAPTSLQPCGGDLPPCYVKARESGGRYDAFNPTGCAANGIVYGCFGAWQFGGFWAGKLGLPLNLAYATPAEQDDAARELWAGGRGCGNWAAC